MSLPLFVCHRSVFRTQFKHTSPAALRPAGPEPDRLPPSSLLVHTQLYLPSGIGILRLHGRERNHTGHGSPTNTHDALDLCWSTSGVLPALLNFFRSGWSDEAIVRAVALRRIVGLTHDALRLHDCPGG